MTPLSLIGHEQERSLLQRLALTDRPPQSYLFSGPTGVGKKLVALEFARSLAGFSSDDERQPDVLVVAPVVEESGSGSKRRKITVEQARSVILFLSRYPAVGKRRVAIIDDAHELSPEAGNALLKTLEEPEEQSVLILVTHRPGKLLPTILSRLFAVSFDLVPAPILRQAYGHRAEHIPDFFFSLGLPGLLHQALEAPDEFRERQEYWRDLFQLSRLTVRERLRLAESLAGREDILPGVLDTWLTGLYHQAEGMSVARRRKLLLFLDRLQADLAVLTDRRGNARLLLEKIFLSL